MVDISAGAQLTIPDAGARYVSVMLTTRTYINGVFHQPGVHELTVDEFDTPYVLVGPRTLVDPADPADPADVAEVNALQDQFQLQAASAATFTPPSTTSPTSTSPVPLCSSWRKGSAVSRTPSAPSKTSTLFVT